MRSDQEYLLDILESIRNIEKYKGHSHSESTPEELIQVWVIHHLRIIGEAVNRLSDGFKKANPDIPWKSIVGMRNILVHAYFGINYSRIDAVVQNDLEPLKQKVIASLQQHLEPDQETT